MRFLHDAIDRVVRWLDEYANGADGDREETFALIKSAWESREPKLLEIPGITSELILYQHDNSTRVVVLTLGRSDGRALFRQMGEWERRWWKWRWCETEYGEMAW
jgi:hypothetical protein